MSARSSLYALAIATVMAAELVSGDHLQRPLVRAVAESVAPGYFSVPDSMVAREITAGETHTYQTTLPSNNYFRASVDFLGTDATITVVDPDGQVLEQLNSLHYGATQLGS